MIKKIITFLLLLMTIGLTGCEHGTDHIHILHGKVVQINVGENISENNYVKTVIIEDKNNKRLDIGRCLDTLTINNDWLLVSKGDYVYVEYFLAEDDWNAFVNTATIFQIKENKK